VSATVDILRCPRCDEKLSAAPSELSCESCGARYPVVDGIPILLPPDLDDLQRRYLANYESVAGADMDTSLEPLREARHASLRKFIGNVSGKRILDIGASDASFLRSLDHGQGVALDIALPYLKTIPSASNLISVCGDAEHLPFARNTFDVILITDVLEHVLNPENVVEGVLRVAKPNARIIVEVPWEEKLDSYRDSPWEFTHLRSFDLFSFSSLWSKFRIVRMRDSVARLDVPLFLDDQVRLPLPLLNRLRLAYYFGKLADDDFAWRRARLDDGKPSSRLLLRVSRPLVRQFELRPFSIDERLAAETAGHRLFTAAGRLIGRLL
jgi:uncharacterized protein YbaR (Trm112 family)